MKSLAGTLAAPFPYFGGKALACADVWAAFGEVDNYVEPFAGSAAIAVVRRPMTSRRPRSRRCRSGHGGA